MYSSASFLRIPALMLYKHEDVYCPFVWQLQDIQAWFLPTTTYHHHNLEA
jgi:hypothetical protein